MAKIVVYADGGIQPKNPGGVCTYGFVVDSGGREIHQENGVVAKSGTNNIAEYGALIAALRWLAANGHKDSSIEIRMDSQLVIKQMKREWACRNAGLQILRRKAHSYADKFSHLSFVWIPRDQNHEADWLAGAAYGDYQRGLLEVA